MFGFGNKSDNKNASDTNSNSSNEAVGQEQMFFAQLVSTTVVQKTKSDVFLRSLCIDSVLGPERTADALTPQQLIQLGRCAERVVETQYLVQKKIEKLMGDYQQQQQQQA